MKIVCIDTGLFNLQFRWNPKGFGVHLGILLGLIFLNGITNEYAVHRLCLIILILDLLLILFLLLRGFNIHVEDEVKVKKENTVKTKPETTELDVQVAHNKAKRKEKEEKVQVIRNKVPSPNLPIVKPETKSVDSVTPVQETTEEKDKVVAEKTAKFNQGEMSAEDWNELFNIQE